MKANVEYGLLYNWYAATDVRNIAPAGWHLPSEEESTDLSTYLGGGAVAGGKMKEIGIVYWDSPNIEATNESGFNGRGSGARFDNNGIFVELKVNFHSWTSTGSFGAATVMSLLSNDNNYYYWAGKLIGSGLSIRLIKDDSVDTGTMTGNDGKVYPTVTIGTQVWMAANLAETKYRNGDTIPEVTNSATWGALTTGALCAYNNDWNNV